MMHHVLIHSMYMAFSTSVSVLWLYVAKTRTVARIALMYSVMHSSCEYTSSACRSRGTTLRSAMPAGRCIATSAVGRYSFDASLDDCAAVGPASARPLGAGSARASSAAAIWTTVA